MICPKCNNDVRFAIPNVVSSRASKKVKCMACGHVFDGEVQDEHPL